MSLLILLNSQAMQLIPLNRTLKGLSRVSMVLTLLSAFVVIFIGWTTLSIHRENMITEQFLINAKDVKPNFENSLQIYTENTEDAIAFVHSLRPDDEIDYINFISTLEDLGHLYGLNLGLSTIESSVLDAADVSNTLNYKVDFYGGLNEVNAFLYGLEELPYYIRIGKLEYSSLSYLSESDSDEKGLPNVSLTLKLYVK